MRVRELRASIGGAAELLPGTSKAAGAEQGRRAEEGSSRPSSHRQTAALEENGCRVKNSNTSWVRGAHLPAAASSPCPQRAVCWHCPSNWRAGGLVGR